VETRYEQESEMSSTWRRFAFLIIVAVAGLLLFPTPARAESTFDQIKRTGELRYGAIDYPPNWFPDKTAGKWQGFLVEVAEDVAKEWASRRCQSKRPGRPASSTCRRTKRTSSSDCKRRQNAL
jgi:hypothetical protein